MYYKTKYNAKKTVVDNIVFDSKAEANRYKELKFLEKRGQIKDLKLQPVFILQDKFTLKNKGYSAIKYIADFEYIENNKIVVEDVKGIETPVFKLKMKLFLKKYGQNVIFKIVK